MNRSRKQIPITEETVFNEGWNNRFSNLVNPDMWPITLGLGAWHGVKQNGVQIDPDNLDFNITILKTEDDWRLRFAGPNHKQEFKEQLPAYVTLRKAIEARGGADALAAWVIFVDAIRAGSVGLDWVDFKTAFKANSVGNITEITAFIEVLKGALPDGWGWVEVRDWVNEKTRDQLTGVKTEVVEVWE
jgi:hypothetical protein